MNLSLPEAKLCEFSDLLHAFSTKRRASRKQLETLCGKLSWAAQVITGGRTFLRRIIDLKDSVHHNHHKILLSEEFHADLDWWLSFLRTFNGTRLIQDPKPITSIQTDACNTGAGGYYDGDYFYVNWQIDTPLFECAHINVKELLAVYFAVCRWSSVLANKRVIIYTDNKSTAAWVNKGSSRNKLSMMILRVLFWICASVNVSLKAIYLPGARNVIADTYSRLQERDKLTLLYDLIPSYTLSCETFEPCSLAYHMSLNFIYSRWGYRVQPPVYSGGLQATGVG